ncbi:MAG: response regulator [Cyclobacteriaceae bacterium]|nr:response regulator [Cyclobacteriaceae bacterium]UYN85563.1 MAG: response regulator [Cyclobacteriaceae bacterium]
MVSANRQWNITWLWAILLVMVLHSYNGYAQPAELYKKKLVFDQLQEELSLSQSSINCILQDSEGYLWIGTWSGLIRYDGYTTTVFHSENQPGKLQSNKILTLFEDQSGFLWIGTHMGGLFRYNKNNSSFEKFVHDELDPTSLSNNNIRAIQEDANGNLWIGTENGINIRKKNSSGFSHITTKTSPSLTHDFITAIHRSANNEIWVGTVYGLNKLQSHDDRYVFKSYLYDKETDNQALHNHIYDIASLPTETGTGIWLTTKKGLKALINGQLSSYSIPNKPASYSLFSSLLVVAGDHPYLIAGSESGISFFNVLTMQFDERKLTGWNEMNLSHGSVTSLYIDRGGVLWVGTKKGINKFDSYTKEFESFTVAQFDKTKSIITGVQLSATGGYWISTIGGGLYKFDGINSFTKYKIVTPEENTFTEFVQTLYSDGKGSVWVGTAGAGVYHFNEHQLTTSEISSYNHYATETNSILKDNYIMAITSDGRDNVLIGTWGGGLYKILQHGDVIRYEDPRLSIAPNVVLYVDRSGTTWVGTRGNGFFSIKEGGEELKVEHYKRSETNSINDNFINCIYEDHAGIFWLATDGGLSSFDRRRDIFEHYKIEGGPSNDVIVSILEDSQGKLWLAHWNGLTVVDPADQTWTRNYDRNDHIMGGFFYNNVCVKGLGGELLFAGSEGFNRIDTKKIIQRPENSPLAITQFGLFGKNVAYGEEVNGRILLDGPLRNNSKIELKHFENSVAFEFASLDFAAPPKIRYAYMLEGFNDTWNYTESDRRFANYTNLNPGTYTFKVKASGIDGIWQEEYSQISLVIHPPWWKTFWAAVLYVLLGFVALYIFRRFILLRANLLHDIKLERLQRENLEKLNKAKLDFFTNISHEFRTPLTLILGPAQSLLESGELSKQARNLVSNISDNSQRLLRLVNQLLDFRKAESGNLNLKVSEGNIVRFVREIKLSFDALAEQMQIQFIMETTHENIKVWFDRNQFEIILLNLLSNAFKHTPQHGTIILEVNDKGNTVELIVKDSGKGIKQEHFEHIFQTFFSYDENRQHTGTGIGLALSKSLVEMHQGTIQVESKEGEYTHFKIILKKGKEHFIQEEIQPWSDDLESMDHYPSLIDTEWNSISYEEPVEKNDRSRLLPKLLIVEDVSTVRAYIKSIFNNAYTVIEATQGEEGWEKAITTIPDVIISDVMMPVMDGITLCKRLKSDKRTSHIPLILLTARTSLIYKIEGLETGADEYLTKPFNPKVLELKVRNLLQLRTRLHEAFRDRQVLNIEPKKVTLNSADELFIQQVLESIESNMTNVDYTIENLCQDVAMSRMQVYRKLKALTGFSANEFIRCMRLKRAAQLLEQHQLTVAEVTYEVGFTDLPYFRECFKKMFGVTPSEYAQRNIMED